MDNCKGKFRACVCTVRENSELASLRSTGTTTRRPTDRSRGTRRKKMEHTDGDDCQTTAAPAAAPSTSSCLPLLVFEHQGEEYDDDDEYNNIPEMLMFSISQQSLHRNMEHELLAKNACTATPQGWVLLDVPSPSTSKAWLWNPQTGDKLSLPDIGEEHVIPGDYCNCLLSHKNVADPGCVVVLVDLTEPNLWFCRVDGSSGWSTTSAIMQYRRSITLPPRRSSPASQRFKGSSTSSARAKTCALSISCPRLIMVFQNSTISMSVYMVDFPEGMNSGACWLVESQDELFLVCICFLGFDPDKIGAIHVYNMDFSKEQAWCRVHDIGDLCFFCLMQTSQLPAPSSPRRLGNFAQTILDRAS